MRALKTVCFFLSLGICAFVAVYVIPGLVLNPAFSRTETTGVNDTDSDRTSLELRIDESKRMYELALIGLGATAVMLFGSKDRRALGRKDRPELMMMAVGGLSLAMSMLYSFLFIDKVGGWYSMLATIDRHPRPTLIPSINAPDLRELFYSQAAFLTAGLVATGFAFISAYKFQISNQEEQ